MSARIQRADWVCIKDWPASRGIVTRVARDGSWAIVRWHEGGSKRMRSDTLEVLHTILLGNGLEVTDITRQRELAQQREGGAR